MTKNKQHAAAPVKALLGRKLGMTQVWDADGRLVPLTVVQVGTNVVTQLRTEETDGYTAIQLGWSHLQGSAYGWPHGWCPSYRPEPSRSGR